MQDFRKTGVWRSSAKGSHIIMQLKIDEATITVPVPNHSELRTGTLRSIIRQSSLSRELFEVI